MPEPLSDEEIERRKRLVTETLDDVAQQLDRVISLLNFDPRDGLEHARTEAARHAYQTAVQIVRAARPRPEATADISVLPGPRFTAVAFTRILEGRFQELRTAGRTPVAIHISETEAGRCGIRAATHVLGLPVILSGRVPLGVVQISVLEDPRVRDVHLPVYFTD
jgi:hypothetical protein